MKKRTIFIFGGVTLLLLAILIGAFFAGPLFALANVSQTTAGTPTTTTNPYCEQYLQDLAHRLNVSVSTLQQDKLAAKEDVLKQRLTSRHECSGKGLYGQRAILSQFLVKYRSDIANEVALGLHLSTDQLVSQLKSV